VRKMCLNSPGNDPPPPSGELLMPAEGVNGSSNSSLAKYLLAINVLCVIISASAGAISVYFANVASRQTQISEENTLHEQLRSVLWLLGDLKEVGIVEDDSPAPCIDGGCLGGMALSQASYERYQLLTLEAIELARQIDHRITPIERLELADALYFCGRLSDSNEMAIQAGIESSDHAIAFRTKLLQAQVAFVREQLDEARGYVREALDIADKAYPNDSERIPSSERTLMTAHAHLVCGTMHLAIGHRDEARNCLKHAYSVLNDAPNAPRAAQMLRNLRTLLRAYQASESPKQAKDFESFEKDVREGTPVLDEPPTPHPSATNSHEKSILINST
jgi:tetratricopeptide (TPR) repeat protein